MWDFVGVGKLSEGKPEGCWIDKNGTLTEKAVGEENTLGLRIPISEGLVLIVKENDWVVKNCEGEITPCKSELFEKTYDLITGKGDE